MKLIDRIALNRAISIVLNFIIQVVEIFSRKSVDNPNPTPSPRPRPIKNIIDRIIPWRKNNE